MRTGELGAGFWASFFLRCAVALGVALAAAGGSSCAGLVLRVALRGAAEEGSGTGGWEIGDGMLAEEFLPGGDLAMIYVTHFDGEGKVRCCMTRLYGW